MPSFENLKVSQFFTMFIMAAIILILVLYGFRHKFLLTHRFLYLVLPPTFNFYVISQLR